MKSHKSVFFFLVTVLNLNLTQGKTRHQSFEILNYAPQSVRR